MKKEAIINLKPEISVIVDTIVLCSLRFVRNNTLLYLLSGFFIYFYVLKPAFFVALSLSACPGIYEA